MSKSTDIEFELNNLNEIYEINKVAKQANGSVLLKVGKTVILAAVVSEFDNPVEEDFMPLTVQYIEKTYASGKFPGGFIKRESKPSDFETLTSRIVDRSLRPLFPDGFRYPTQITIMVLSTDEMVDLQLLALNAASAALYISDIPVKQIVTAVRVGVIDQEIKINPTKDELDNSTLDLFVAGSGSDLLMIEMKSNSSIDIKDIDIVDPMAQIPVVTTPILNSNEIQEDRLLEILKVASEAIKDATEAYISAFNEVAKTPQDIELKQNTLDQGIYDFAKDNFLDEIKLAVTKMAKSERNSDLKNIAKSIASDNGFDFELTYSAVSKIKKELVREMIIDQKVRADGRVLNEVRPISIETNILPNVHGSCLFTRGETQALVVATLGDDKDAQMYERVGSKTPLFDNFMVHYNFPGFSVGEAKPVFAPGRRELGHGNLAKRALEPVINLDSKESIRLVSEVLESNGSSSMATVCGGSLALKAANVESSKLIAGVAMGLVIEDGKHAILSDIMGLEDHDGDMDFKVAGSRDGITAMQMDIKLGGLDFEILKEALYQAKEAREHILSIMEDANSKIEINEDALPALAKFSINPSKIAMVIGKAGSTIKEIIEKFEVSIDLDRDSGNVKVTGKSRDGVQKAIDHIKSITSKEDTRNKRESVRFDELYTLDEVISGKVVKIVDFGAFLALPKGGEGLLHISKLSNKRVNKVTDIVNDGDQIDVRVLRVSRDRIELASVEVASKKD